MKTCSDAVVGVTTETLPCSWARGCPSCCNRSYWKEKFQLSFQWCHIFCHSRWNLDHGWTKRLTKHLDAQTKSRRLQSQRRQKKGTHTHTRSRAIQKPRGGITTSFSWINIQKTQKEKKHKQKHTSNTKQQFWELFNLPKNGPFLRNSQGIPLRPLPVRFKLPFPLGEVSSSTAPLRPPTQLRLCKWIL